MKRIQPNCRFSDTTIYRDEAPDEYVKIAGAAERILAMKPMEDVELDRAIDQLFTNDDRRPCPIGTELIRDFAVGRPVDFAFLDPQDLIDLTNSAFTGIAEWDAFAEHYAGCKRCNGRRVQKC